MLRVRVRFAAALVATILVWNGCGGDSGPTDPNGQTGAVQVTASTTGDNLDSDGYTVALDGGSERPLARDGSTTFSSVATGQHQIALAGLADNCSVSGSNPAPVSVTSGNTAQVTFTVVCAAPTGFVQISTSTSGDDLDPDGYTVTLDGTSDRSIGLNGVVTFTDVAVGTHQVELTGIADNCAVSGSNPATASVTAGETAQVSFDVICDPLPIGSLEVTTTVTNNFDPDGYEVRVAGTLVGRVVVDGTATFDDVAAGAQQVELGEIAPNCAVDGDNPATVDIPVGGTGVHVFSVTCASPPDGRIVYVGRVTGKYGLATMNTDGSGKLLIWEYPPAAPGNGAGGPQWSPDGSLIAFSSAHEDTPRIYVVGQDGSGITRLTDSSADDTGPDWSPDGSRLAFTRYDGVRAAIYLVDADGTDLTLIEPPAGFWDEGPAWSPDGTRIAVRRSAEEPLRAPGFIVVMDADGSNSQEVTPPAPMRDDGYPEHSDAHPAWSPDGNWIALDRDVEADGRVQVFLVRPDGTDLVNLTPSLSHWATRPSWSQDGTRIVFDGSDWGIYTMNADGSNVAEIDPTSTPAGDPDWGP